LIGVAVKVTDVPGQIGFAEATMLTLEATVGVIMAVTDVLLVLSQDVAVMNFDT
jgi:hypothetical protein